jgi:hypothetical protein
MTRRPDLATILLLALLVSLALVLVPREAPAAAPFPTRVQVTSTEFRLSMSRVVVPGGRARVELVNLGVDPHDLKIHRVGGTYTYTIPETLPGERSTKTLRLTRGRYQVWCAVDGHRAWGMRATLRVVPRRGGFPAQGRL